MKKHVKLWHIAIFAMFIVLSLCLVACGTNGIDGKNGTDGKNGKNGIDGKSAYEIWLDNGYTGSQTDFLEWLKGKDGKDGTNGKNGIDGVDGENGKDGQNGIKGDKGDTGEQGPQGDKGQDGADGTDGQNGENGKSAFEIFMQYYPYYTGTEQDWINALINGQLHIYTVTFKSEVSDDMVKHVFQGYDLTDIPEVPEKEGQASATWDISDFTNIRQDMTVNAVYVMQTRTVTFHNEFTTDEDIIITVEYGQAITDIPTVTTKEYNDGYWDIDDLSCIKTDMTVNAVYATQGLQYTPINQQTQYRVSKGEMNTATKELFILAEYKGKPVTVIDEKAFSTANLKFTSAHIPYGITEIRANAFSSCRELTSIAIPNSVTSIEDRVFSSCSELRSIVIPNSITKIGFGAFSGCISLTNVTIPNSVTIIDGDTFEHCSSLTSIEIPESVWYIGNYSFQDCSNLTNIIIPKSVINIGGSAFSGCTLLSTVYFKGTQEQFDKIQIGSGNALFTDSTTYFFSETEPTDDGFYWHYDTDGVTPVIWAKRNDNE